MVSWFSAAFWRGFRLGKSATGRLSEAELRKYAEMRNFGYDSNGRWLGIPDPDDRRPWRDVPAEVRCFRQPNEWQKKEMADRLVEELRRQGKLRAPKPKPKCSEYERLLETRPKEFFDEDECLNYYLALAMAEHRCEVRTRIVASLWRRASATAAHEQRRDASARFLSGNVRVISADSRSRTGLVKK
jgi:hypothetical protein